MIPNLIKRPINPLTSINHKNQEITKLDMELNLNKCELLSYNIQDQIAHQITGKTLHFQQTAKYFGQTIEAKRKKDENNKYI